QAGDGIRDFHVTGVQTCALPISRSAARAPRASRSAATSSSAARAASRSAAASPPCREPAGGSGTAPATDRTGPTPTPGLTPAPRSTPALPDSLSGTSGSLGLRGGQQLL